MPSKDQGKKVFSGMIWSFGERISAQLVTFIVSVVLARFLLPEDFGAVTLIMVFITIANVFVSNGFGEALIQKKDASEEDYSTVFWCSIILSILLYFILYLGAPYIASFYRTEELTFLIRVLSIKLPIASFSTIQHAYVSKHMQFKKFFFSTLLGTVISGVIGILLAYKGFGAWAIVAQYLTNSLIDTIVLLFTVPWRPKFFFDLQSAKVLLGFGWKMMASALINTTYSELRPLIIGRVYTTGELAHYKRGAQFPQLFITNINSAVSAVLFPVIASHNESIVEVKRLTRQSLKATAYLVFPLMVGLAVVAKPLVSILLTDKWLPCVPFLQLACISYGLQPIQTANCQAIKSIGRSDVYLRMEIVKKIVGISLLFAAMNRGVFVIAIADVIAVLFSAIVSMAPNKRLIDYNIKNQLLDILPSIILSLTMGLAVYCMGMIEMNVYMQIIIQVLAGIIIYLILSIITKNEMFIYLLRIVKKAVIK